MKMRLKLFACVLLASAAMALSLPAQAAPVVVTFEDVPATGISDGYGGVSGWSLTGNVFDSFGEGIGDYVFYGPPGPNPSLRFDAAPVVFHGTYYKSYAIDPTIPTERIFLFYQGNLVHSMLDPYAGGAMEWVASGYSGLVDAIQFLGGGEGFGIDNLTYEVATTTNVPEPGSVFLVLSGLLGLGAMRRRKAVL
jgi:hypothetical protein